MTKAPRKNDSSPSPASDDAVRSAVDRHRERRRAKEKKFAPLSVTQQESPDDLDQRKQQYDSDTKKLSAIVRDLIADIELERADLRPVSPASKLLEEKATRFITIAETLIEDAHDHDAELNRLLRVDQRQQQVTRIVDALVKAATLCDNYAAGVQPFSRSELATAIRHVMVALNNLDPLHGKK